MRPRFGPAIAARAASSTAGPSRWTHHVGVTGGALPKDTPTSNANGLGSPSRALIAQIWRAKPVALQPPPSRGMTVRRDRLHAVRPRAA